jgi:polyhydroxybutyrate depolymerase
MALDRNTVPLTWSVPLVACATIVAVAFGSINPARAASTPSSRAVTQSITTSDGRTRTFHLYVPRSLPRHEAVPLLVALHGGFGSGTQFETNSGFDQLAAAHHFIVVYPDGTPIRPSGPLADARVWNGGRCCGPAVVEQVDDVGFVSQLIDLIAQHHDIDPARVYAAGHSNGAIMSYRLACELSDKIVAIGVQAGSLEVEPCQPTHPVSVLHIHGTADRNIPIDGGRGDGIAGIAFQPPRAATATFARADGCAANRATTKSPDNADVSIETWQPCRDGTRVEFVSVAGASHAWMGRASTRGGRALTGAPYMKYDSSAAIWSFLAAHPRP